MPNRAKYRKADNEAKPRTRRETEVSSPQEHMELAEETTKAHSTDETTSVFLSEDFFAIGATDSYAPKRPTQPYRTTRQEAPPWQNAPPWEVVNDPTRTGEILRYQRDDSLTIQDRPPKKRKSNDGSPEGEQIVATKSTVAVDPSDGGAVSEPLHEDSPIKDTKESSEDLRNNNIETNITRTQEQARNELDRNVASTSLTPRRK